MDGDIERRNGAVLAHARSCQPALTLGAKTIATGFPSLHHSHHHREYLSARRRPRVTPHVELGSTK